MLLRGRAGPGGGKRKEKRVQCPLFAIVRYCTITRSLSFAIPSIANDSERVIANIANESRIVYGTCNINPYPLPLSDRCILSHLSRLPEFCTVPQMLNKTNNILGGEIATATLCIFVAKLAHTCRDNVTNSTNSVSHAIYLIHIQTRINQWKVDIHGRLDYGFSIL